MTLEFGPWQKHFSPHSMALRALLPEDQVNYVVLYESWRFDDNKDVIPNSYVWQISFMGDKLEHLGLLYEQLYPTAFEFKLNQLEDAKKRVDEFLDKVNSLTCFL